MMVMHVRMRAGLLEPKHVQAMGGCPLTLYLWLHTRVRFKGEGAGTTFPDKPYRHEDAADALGVSRGTVRDWFRALVAGGYLTTRRLKTGLEVTIEKYAKADESAETPTPSAGQSVENPTPRVPKSQHSSVENPTLSNAPTRSAREELNTRAYKRDIHSPLQGEDASGADAPAPVKRGGNPKVTAVVDALRAEGMRGTITPRDAKAIKDTDHDAGEVAALYRAIYEGDYGDPWMQQNLSVSLCLEKLPGWRSHRAGHKAPGRTNGKPLSGVAAVQAVFAREGIDLERRSGRGRGDAGVGDDEARRGVPRQLRG